jgi:hypothetical protein
VTTGNTAKNTATGPLLSGTWFVEWTDEKEIVFLLQKGFFGLATGMHRIHAARMYAAKISTLSLMITISYAVHIGSMNVCCKGSILSLLITISYSASAAAQILPNSRSADHDSLIADAIPGEVYQTIDNRAGTLDNVILFGKGDTIDTAEGVLAVNAAIQPEQTGARVNFQVSDSYDATLLQASLHHCRIDIKRYATIEWHATVADHC